MKASGLSVPLALSRLGVTCLLLVAVGLVVGCGEGRAESGVRQLSEAVMASVVGDNPKQYCLGKYICTQPIAETAVCAYCASNDTRKVCCEVVKGDPVCTYGLGKGACGDLVARFVNASFVSGYCGTCTGTGQFKEDGNCDTLAQGDSKTACK